MGLSIIAWIVVSSVFSLCGGLFLLWKGEKLATQYASHLVSFAVGVLLTTAFLDLLPEAAEMFEKPQVVFQAALAGMLTFFLLERFLLWFHHHHGDHGIHPTVALLNFGDTLHNFIDGIAIAASFLADPRLGIATGIAVALHEIPQEISDFSIMLASGMKKKVVIIANVCSAAASILGALMVLWFGKANDQLLGILIAFTAGMFIYIAGSDLMPSLHQQVNRKATIMQTVMLGLGVFVSAWLIEVLEHGQ